MKKYRRILALMLTLTMLLNCFSGITVSAVDDWTMPSLESGFKPSDPTANGWIGLTTANISTYTFLSGGFYYFKEDNSKYYLAEDLNMDHTLYVYSEWTVTIDLNGYDISMNEGKDRTVLNLKTNATLNLYDCGTNVRYWNLDEDNVAVAATASDYTFTTTGGAITGGVANAVGGGGVFIQQDATFNMYGGNIVGNQCTSEDDRQGGGVYNYCGTFNLYGGTIQGNACNKTIAGGVYNRSGSTFNMYGGTIAYNYSATYGGGVYNVGTFNMEGGTIEYNTAAIGGGGISTTGEVNLSGGSIQYNTGAWRCGGVYIAANGTLNMSGGSIIYNHSGGGGEAGVGLVYATSTLNMSGGTISGNTTTGASAGVGYTNGTFKVSGTAVIDGNYIVIISNGVKTNVTEANTYLANDNTITVGENFTGTVGTGVGVTLATGTGTVATGASSVDGFVSDIDGYYLVLVDGTITLQSAVDTEGEDDTITYSASIYDVSAMFSTVVSSDTIYTIIGGTGTGTIDGQYLTIDKIGTFIIEADTPYSTSNPPTVETATLTVTAKTVNVTGITAVGTVVGDYVELNNTSGSVVGAVSGDDVSIDFTVAYGTFTDSNYSGAAGTYNVTIHDIALTGDDASNYLLGTVNGGSGTTITVTTTTPYISWPTAKDITYGDTRSNDDLIGGQVVIKVSGDTTSYIDITAAGHFEWVTTENTNAGTHTYEVQFVLDTTNENYSSYSQYATLLSGVTHNITQLVNMAEVEFTITGNVGTSSSGLSIVATTENGKTLTAGTDYWIYFTDATGAWDTDKWTGHNSTPTAVGTYLIGADFTENGDKTPNYVHAGTMESYAKQIGALVVYDNDTVKKPADYDVTFTGYDSYEIEDAIVGDIHILPTVSGYSAWQTTSSGSTVIYEFGSRFSQPAYDVTFTPVSAVSTGGTISGTITGTNIEGTEDAKLEGVVVALVQGADQVAITSTDENGDYKFEDMPQGRYDLVVTRDYVIRNEETIYVELGADDVEVDVELPDTRQNTIFNVAAGMTAITVEGMKELITGTDEIRSIKLELSTAAVADTQDILSAVAYDLGLSANNCKYFLDLSIQERLSDATSYGEIASLGKNDSGKNELLTFYIPLAGIYQGYDNYVLYQDTGTIIKLGSTPTNDGESMTVKDGLLTLTVQKSGIYGLAFYDNPAKTVDGGTATTEYSADPIDTDDFFDAIESDGARTYVITGGTGEGTIDSDGYLTVTKFGTFNITVNVAATAEYDSIKGTGVLTVTKKEVTITGITCVDCSVSEVVNSTVDINAGGRVSGVEAGDRVSINFTSGYATITDTDFAEDTTLITTGENSFDTTVTGLSLTGADAINYTIVGDITSQVTLTTTVDTSEVYIAWPTATDLVYGETQSDDDLYGGKVMVRQTDGTYVDITDCGTFQWATVVSDTPDNVGTSTYQVKFVENTTVTGELFTETAYRTELAAATQYISQTVQPAAVTFTVDDCTLEYGKDNLSITITAENGKTLVEGTDYDLYYTNSSGNWIFDGEGNLVSSNIKPTAVGTYLVGASLTENYHHAGTLESIAKQIGAFTIYDSETSEAPATYSTTFMVGESTYTTYTDALPDTIHNLPNLDDGGAYDGLYTGWLLNGTTYEFEGRYTQPGSDVTFTAIAAPEKTSTIYGTVSGTDLDQTTGLISRVSVALYQGNTLIDITETDSDGTYSFTAAPGLYNVVITWHVSDTETNADTLYQITEFVDASGDDAYVGADFTLTDILQNVVLEVTKGLPDIVVEGLDALVDTTVDSEVLMQITPNTTKDQTTVDAMVAYAVSHGIAQSDVKLFMNIDVSHNGEEVTDTEELMTFYIPLTGTFQGNEEYTVYRYHNGSIQTLTESANALGEYIEISEDKTNLVVHARLYSLYGIAFANETYTPSTGSTSKADEEVEDAEALLPFVDVSVDDWFYEDVLYLYELGIMIGTTDTTFEPYTDTSRAMAAQVMYNLEGQPERTEIDFFPDVTVGKWYEEAINWCAANGVVDGYPDGLYRPDQMIIREEFIAILYDHCLHLGYDMSALNDLSTFEDTPSVWAATYVMWAVEAGIVQGDADGYLNGTNLLTRCEAAAMLARFLRDIYQET